MDYQPESIAAAVQFLAQSGRVFRPVPSPGPPFGHFLLIYNLKCEAFPGSHAPMPANLFRSHAARSVIYAHFLMCCTPCDRTIC